MYLTPADLAPFATIDEAKASAMIEDAEASAAPVSYTHLRAHET